MQVYDVIREFQGHFAATRSSTRFIVVHHAAFDYPPYFGRDDVAAIANYHISKGWSGIGYHEVLAQETNNGPIAAYIVSNPVSVRAHVAGRNHECFGICMAANFSRTTPTPQWLDALALRLVEAKRRWPSAQIVGHQDIALSGHGTSCPGDRWSAWRPALLVQVDAMLKQRQPPVLHTVTAGPHGALAQEDRRPGALTARYYPPGSKIVCDDLQLSYWHCADHSGFIPLGQVQA